MHQWDLNQAQSLSLFVHHITDPARRQIVESVIAEWTADVGPRIGSGSMRSGSQGKCMMQHKLTLLYLGMIQADFNDANIVLNEEQSDIGGVIDFGDTVNSLLVNDLAIAMAYSMVSTFGKKYPLEAAAAV